MFDPILNRYELTCADSREDVLVPVSSFRRIRRLRGATRPAVFRVEFLCSCSRIHEVLVPHDQLDWSPLGTANTETYTDLVSGKQELLGFEFIQQASLKLRKGNWPWVFWCHPESALKPGFPSSLRFVTPEHEFGTERVGTLVRCQSCSRHTVNIVSRDHLDVPWHTDHHIGYVAEIFDGETVSDEEYFRHQLNNGTARIGSLRATG